MKTVSVSTSPQVLEKAKLYKIFCVRYYPFLMQVLFLVFVLLSVLWVGGYSAPITLIVGKIGLMIIT